MVIGPSMGGQVARYALSYMERNNLPHNTRLFLSLDSPHNGATIPIGLQYFVDFFAGVSDDEELKNGLAQLDSPASRELTVHHHSQGTAFRPDPSRTQFLNDLSSFGNYPSQLRRVAVTNGALDGTPQADQNSRPLQPGQQMFVFEQRGVPGSNPVSWVLGLLSRLITTASARVYYEPGYGQTQQVLASYYAAQGRHAQEATGPPGSCGLDSSPGGYRKFVTFAQSSGGLTQERNFYSVRDRACFIPVTSALGYNQQPTDNCQPAGQNLVCSGTTAFDAYYGPTGHNEEHLQLTPGNVEFIRNEILLKTPTPVFIVAPTEICATGNATFSVKGECVSSRAGQPQAGITYTWTPGPGLQVASGQGTATVQVKSTVNTATDSYLEVVAARTGFAASPAVRVSVHTGLGEISPAISTNGDCAGSIVTLTVSSHNVEQDFKWSFGPNLIYNPRYDGQSSIQYQLPTSGPRSWPVRVTAHDKCNAPALITTTSQILVTYAAGCENFRLASPPPSPSPPPAYPNPANGTLTVGKLDTQAAASQTAILYNVQGQEVRHLSGKGPFSFVTADLPTGLYLLVVQQEGQVNKVQVQIQH